MLKFWLPNFWFYNKILTDGIFSTAFSCNIWDNRVAFFYNQNSKIISHTPMDFPPHEHHNEYINIMNFSKMYSYYFLENMALQKAQFTRLHETELIVYFSCTFNGFFLSWTDLKWYGINGRSPRLSDFNKVIMDQNKEINYSEGQLLCRLWFINS